MPNTDQLKSSMTGMNDRIKQDVAQLRETLGSLQGHNDSAVRDAVTRAAELATNVANHLEAFVQTAFVAADSAPMRGGDGLSAGRDAPRPAQLPAADPTRMSGVPETPPGGPFYTPGPAAPHDDVGPLDAATGETQPAPAAVGDAVSGEERVARESAGERSTDEHPEDTGDQRSASDARPEGAAGRAKK